MHRAVVDHVVNKRDLCNSVEFLPNSLNIDLNNYSSGCVNCVRKITQENMKRISKEDGVEVHQII